MNLMRLDSYHQKETAHSLNAKPYSYLIAGKSEHVGFAHWKEPCGDNIKTSLIVIVISNDKPYVLVVMNANTMVVDGSNPSAYSRIAVMRSGS